MTDATVPEPPASGVPPATGVPPAPRRPSASANAMGPGGIESPGWPLIEVQGLEVHFPIRGGFMRHAATAPARGRARGRRHRPDAPARRGPRARRRVGQRQDDDRSGHRQAHQADRRHASGSRTRTSASCGASPKLRHYRRRVQLIFQDPYETLNPKQTIYDFVAEPLVVNGIGTGDGARRRRVMAALEAAGLRPASDFAFRFPHELSGGQRQRVVIAGRPRHGPRRHRRRRAGLDARRLDPDRAAAADARPPARSAA